MITPQMHRQTVERKKQHLITEALSIIDIELAKSLVDIPFVKLSVQYSVVLDSIIESCNRAGWLVTRSNSMTSPGEIWLTFRAKPE